MSAFEDRPELRGVAERAARAFLSEDVSLELLGHGQSQSWSVAAPGGRYLLRIHAPRIARSTDAGFSSPRAIESECAWLRALGEDTALVVPQPVADPEGEHVHLVPRADGAGPVPCTLLTWVEGEVARGPRTAEQAARLGELLAALHAHAARWERPPRFERPVHEPAAWRGALAAIDGLVERGVVTAADRALLGRAVQRLEAELAPLAGAPGRIGLVHADLHAENVLFHGGSPRPIDFGRAVIGPWLYDVAECLGQLGPARRRDLVDAYARRRPLADGDERRLEGYLVASLVEVFAYHAPDPAERGYLARAVPAWAPHVRRYVEGESFLFEALSAT